MNKNLLIVLAFLLFNIGYGQTLKTWTGSVSTAWDIDENWDGGEKPTANDDVLITSATNQPVITNAGASCNHLELRNSTPGTTVVLTIKGMGEFSPGSIVMNSIGGDTSDCSLNISGTGQVIVSGNITMNGNALQNDVTFSGDGNLLIGGIMTGGVLNADEKGTVTYNGVGTRNIGNYTYNNLTISGTGVRTITSGVIVNGKLNMAGTATVTAAPTYGVDASLQYTAVSYTVGPEWVSPFAAKGGVLISTPGLTIASTVTMGSSVTDKKFNDGVALIVRQDASLVFGNTDLYLGGDFINNNGSLKTDGFVYLIGNVSQSIASFTSSKGVAMNKNAGTATFTGNINTKRLIINGLGTLSLGTGLTHTFTDWERTNGTLNARSSVLKFSGNVIGTGGTFIPGTSTVEFNGGAQNLGTGSITYNNLTLSGTGTKTFGAKTTINETISIVSGVVADLTANLVHTAKYIKLGDTAQKGGSWGSKKSNAVNQNDTFFALNNGIVNVGPTIAVSTNNLEALSSIYGSPTIQSELKSFTISGLAMTEGVSVKAPEGFEVSINKDTNFADSITVGAAGNFSSITVYVRLKGTINAGIEKYSGDILLKSPGTADVKVAIAKSTVNKAVLKIITENKARTYGDDDPDLTVAYDKFLNGDTVDSLTKLPTITTTALPTSPITNAVNKYEITATGAESSNYTFDYTKKGELTITPALLTITVKDAERERGAKDPTFILIYSEFKNNESESVFTKKPTITTTAVKDSPVGAYDIIVDGAEALNYTFKYIKGTLKVTESSNNDLIGLTTNRGDLNPDFTKENKKYEITVENKYTNIEIKATTSDSKATITVEGKAVNSGEFSREIELKVGENIIKTIVIAEDKTETTYEIKVIRKPSGEARLSDVVINGVDSNTPVDFSTPFDKDKKESKVNVPNETTSIVITPIPMEPNATVKMFVDGVEVTDRTAPVDLKVGDNVITYVVTAQDLTTEKEYTVVVNRAEPKKSSDADLENITVSESALDSGFNKEDKEYKVDVPNATDSIVITPTPRDPNASVEMKIGDVTIDPTAPIDLKVGDNIITIVVKAEDGTYGEPYEMIVTREEPTDKPSSNASLSDIVISDGTLSPAFNTDTKDYRVDVPYETDSIIITPKTIDPNATVEMIVDGKTITDPTAPIDLKVGENVITIVVTAEDNTTKEIYTVIVNRADDVPQVIVPSNIITPNGDGKNDTWVVPGLDKYPNNSVKVFDRAARLVYSKDNYNNDWDGTFKGSPVNEDTYYYLIDLGNGSPKLKGFISILRN
ncbi:cadherin-like beta sandwich domain-containing protein [Flavobacterium sp. MMLR14_040]|uniref:cadherin-like beta sandwich domain-containing protein n=1 Tax=Flavobacterium sp. MMLR14_040 TaxID=3093843 RepID=UPI002990489C|nr:cadherin-like beta sandwich domain-containing protein [Flavobacterium sp. MMLR14_040]MDW8849969.1 cadherin-like beta sandwich domain-containing protein [Flavobacterium sp. MMLR14_040]